MSPYLAHLVKVSSVAIPDFYSSDHRSRERLRSDADADAKVIGFKIEILIGNVRSKFSRTHDSAIDVTDTGADADADADASMTRLLRIVAGSVQYHH